MARNRHPLCSEHLSGGSYPLSLLLACLFPAGMVHLQKSGNLVGIITIACWFCLSLASVVALDWLGRYFFSFRQVVSATPPVLFGAAVGISALPDSPIFSRRVFGGLAMALILAISLGTIVLSDKQERDDWNGLAAFLEEYDRDDQWVVAPSVQRIVSFKTPGLVSGLKPLDGLESHLGAILSLRVIESRYQTQDQQEALRRLVGKARSKQLTLINGFLICDLDLARKPLASARQGASAIVSLEKLQEFLASYTELASRGGFRSIS